MSVFDGAQPWHHVGNDVGVLVSHGFTGSPVSMRPWAEHLAKAGFTVNMPLLPGHGTRWEDLNRTTWSDWYQELDGELTALRSTCRLVVVAGLSMGGTLALRLAEKRGTDVDALMLVNPAVQLTDPRLRLLPVMKRVLPSLPAIGNDIKRPGIKEASYDRTPLRALHSMVDLSNGVRADLGLITQPLLLFRSTQDHVVPTSNGPLLMNRVSSADLTDVILPDSFHVATLDHDAPTIFRRSVEFVNRIAGISD